MVLGEKVNIKNNVKINSFSHIENTKIESNVIIGPYARLRPGTKLLSGSRIGNFVEVKKSVVGQNTKVNHLSYIGDTNIGSQTNIGAGTITCNYDGKRKYKTKIKNKVFVGSNSSLVAPVTLENNSIIGAGSVITKRVKKRKYNIQRIDGLEESKVTPPESVYKRIKKENNAIGEARAINSNLQFFREKFIMTVKVIISVVYGSQRILNGKPKWPHYGIDIAAKKGTKIKSSGSGIVTMAEDDLYYTGGTIIMDHGHGISTIYSHLEDIMVDVGDEIKQGDIIGTVGSTGRSTGPHLDFRINWFQTRLDPMSILQ